ncbi:MAG: hypothetical protein J0H01_11700 [Rhizobiales bacterium]|nr:hypothetical protein [Hyphomicrobiales bacterium]
MANIISKSFYGAAFNRGPTGATADTGAKAAGKAGAKPATGGSQDASVLLLGSADGERQAGAYSLFGSSKTVSEAQKSARDLLTKLDQMRTSAVSDRKASAQQKLELARQKLQMLRMMGGDPKMIARQAKQIAQEIREAAREYGAAVQSGAAALGTGAAEAPPAPAEAAAAKGAEAATGAADQATGAEGQTQAAKPAEAAQAGQADKGQPGQGAAEKGAADKGSVERGSVDKATAREEAAKAYQDMAAKLGQKGAASTAEREVLDKFKQAAAEVKRLIEDAVRKLRARNANDPDAREAEKAKNAMLKEVDQLGDTMRAAETGADATVPATAGAGIDAAIAVPVINILA